ncbi:hypothetical protein BC830DRAFT_674136 [Chytriomyces sp. MP71]|nr:hypothetical protein BC830DRAFT_674136 [Chytriomyces sp. MP71]
MEITSIDAVLIELVMRVARSYYAAHFIIILDLLALRGPTHEKTVAAALRISPVDTRKLCKRLETDRLIKANSRSIETKYGKHTKKHTETYYYIDYKSLINVIKYRFFKMQEVIKKEIEDHNNNLAYECPKCRAKFDPYTVLRMIRPEDGMFACENCQSILEQEKGTDFGNDLSTRSTSWNIQRGTNGNLEIAATNRITHDPGLCPPLARAHGRIQHKRFRSYFHARPRRS